MRSVHHSRSLILSIAAAAFLLVALAPRAAEAQRRYRRPVVRSVVIVAGHPYHRHWMYDPWYQWGPYGYPPYGYRYGLHDVTSAVRLDVSPRQAQVFVDGYYAGIVDEFDGVFQRLRVQPGGHTITLYLEGYRTESQDLYLPPGHDERIRLNLQPLAPGETAEPPAPPLNQDRGETVLRERPEVGRPGEPGRRVDPPSSASPAPREAPARFGTLSLRVQPSDAEVFVDGERWSDGGTGTERMEIQLTEGRHHIEVRRAGLVTYSEDVLVRRDRILTLNVALAP